MMAAAQSISAHEPDAAENRPNSRLREVREARHLSVEAVATSLRLEPKIIQALENAAYDQLPAPAYVRGYLRNYATLLGMDSARLIDAYNAEAGEAPPLKAASSRPATQARSSDRAVKFVTFLVSATLVALLGVWLYSEYRNQISIDSLVYEQSQSNALEQPSGGDAAYNLGYTYPVVHHPDTPLAPKLIYPDADDGIEQTSDQDADDDSLQSTSGSTEDISDANADIMVAVSADSWVEIYDSSGQRLHFGLRHAGDVVSVSGQRPYRLILGNAPQVKLVFEGREIDFSAFTTLGVARFSLDDTGIHASE